MYVVDVTHDYKFDHVAVTHLDHVAAVGPCNNGQKHAWLTDPIHEQIIPQQKTIQVDDLEYYEQLWCCVGCGKCAAVLWPGPNWDDAKVIVQVY